jgi:hypothetical protein
MRHAGGTLFLVFAMFLGLSAWAQEKPVRREHRPSAQVANDPTAPQAQPNYIYFSILDGTPQGLTLHHDTIVGTGQPIDVYMFPIELQVMNSDGNLEPEGLIIDNFYTAAVQDPNTAPNINTARDCRKWNALVLHEEAHQGEGERTWSYVEFTVAMGARIVQTNEDGNVWWADDIQCWGARDRFSPF